MTSDRSDEARIETQAQAENWAISPEALFRVVDDEAVILDLETQQYFGLDPVGARIWQLLEEHGDTESVVRGLLDEYEVEEPRLRSDVHELLKDLAERGLISAVDGNA